MDHVEYWPIVGRHEELAFLGEALRDPRQRGALVAGEAGVGKTRLVREALSSLQESHVETVTATESGCDIPFGAFAHLLPEDLRHVDRIDLLAFIGRHLVERAAQLPFVLTVDDAHLLDGSSAALVQYLAEHSRAKVLIAMRSHEIAPDAIVGLYRSGLLKRLELQPISQEEFGLLLEMVLGEQVESATSDRMWQITEGNVLFAHELIADALAADTLVLRHGVWRWSGRVERAPRLREMIASRLKGLDTPDRRVLQLISLAEPLDCTAVEQIISEGSLSNLEILGLVAIDTEARPTSVRLGHPLIGEVLRASMPGSARRVLTRALITYFAQQKEFKPDVLLRLAVWKEAIGDQVDAGTLVDAAQMANQLGDHRLAEQLARAVLPQIAFKARLELGWALIGQARYEDAVEVLLSILATPEVDDSDLERLADAIAQAVGHGLGRIDDAGKFIAMIEGNVTDPEISALIRCHRANLLAFHCRYLEAAELGSEALRCTANDTVRLRALTSVGTSLVMAGRTDEVLDLTDSALPMALRLSDRFPRAPAWVLGTRLSALALNGRISEAICEIEQMMPSTPRGSVLAAQGGTLLGRLYLLQGRAATARRLLFDAAATARENPAVREPSWCVALAGEAEALLGHTQEAMSLAEEAVSLRRTEVLAYEVDERRALAWVEVQAGRISSAIDQLWEASALAGIRGQRCFNLLILHDLLRLGETQAVSHIAELAPLVDGALAGAVAGHANAVSSGAPEDIELAAQRFEEIGLLLIGAELFAAASVGYRQKGLRVRATAARKASTRLAMACEGTRTQPLLWVDTSETSLTRRQREIAVRAAQGSTNAQIAVELSVSERTVESHLYSVFAKLGISERSQLAQGMAGSSQDPF
jgi:DNA-binding CsgD family transcriptional regulator/tetratricopeptide (TPR) repeat protein